MSQGEAISIPTPSARLAGLAWGPADAPVVLAVHGWLDNAASFAAVAPHLPGLRIVALDLPGHGLSEHLPAGFSYPFVDWMATVHAVVRWLDTPTVALFGHSMGAAITSLYAGTFPDRVRRLVAIEGLGPLAEPEVEAPARLAKALESEGATPRTTTTRDREGAVAKFAEARSLTPAQAEALAARAMHDEAQGVRWRFDPRLRSPSRWRMTEAMVHAYLQRITCPVLAIRASRGSPFAPGPKSPRLLAVPHGELLELEGGHHLHVSHPEAVAERVGPWLRGETP